MTAPKTATRIQAIDWMRGLVMVLMTVDHAGARYDAHHMHGDNAATWVVGSPLPADEFLTRWVTHVCAPLFVLLAGTSLGFAQYHILVLQVLYAIGLSMVLMAGLRRLPTTALAVLAGALLLAGEL